MRTFFLYLTLFLFLNTLKAQINPTDITIIRDIWGVPHIYGKTDVSATYGLAWAQCEDNFYNMQEALLGTRGLAAEVKGKDGALLDAIFFFVDAVGIVKQKYETDVSENFKQMLNAYAQALNKYATLYPKEVRHKDLFPITEKDVLAGYVGSMAAMSNVTYDIIRIFEGTIKNQEADNFFRGSNAWAISPSFSVEGKTHLIANSHQPLEGPAAWYECHVVSDEGWNFYGATLPAGVTPFIGTNNNLGWTHTVNYDDYNDVYKLEMHPDNKLLYKFDDNWLELEERVLKLKVKLGPLLIPIKKVFYQSVYGPTLKNDDGFYSLRFSSSMTIKAAEQWYMMNKANTLKEFTEALKIQGLSNLNIVYADKEGNILKVGNGLFPYRNPDTSYYWGGVLPGNTNATLWDTTFMPLDSLVFKLNPKCGYLYNMNHTSFSCTCPEENPNPVDYNPTIGYQPKETGRSKRFQELIKGYEKLSYEELKNIKYDKNFVIPFYTRTIENLDLLRTLNPEEYPDIAPLINIVANWDGSAAQNSKGATIANLCIQNMLKYIKKQGIYDYNNVLPKEVFVESYRFAKKHLLKHFGSINVSLGELQFLVRGDKYLPIWGLPEVITQMYTKPWKKGLYKNQHGESYILFVNYNKDGVEFMEAVQPFGNSSKPNSKHYTDQMELFVEQKLRTVYFEKDSVKKHFESAYHPK